jgi:uncharacterized iron-regulated membrane protein
MDGFRTVLFWMHLTAGALAGVVVLVMCITGVALTYEKQVLEWADTRSWSAPLSAGASHLPPETLLARVRQAEPGAAPAGLVLRADPQAPATLTLEGNQGSLLVDPYTGTVIGPPPQGLRAFFRGTTSWHRYLALEGESRPTGRFITGASNVAFFFIVLSGMYLWIPKTLSWLQVSRVMWFRRGLPVKARHFNWHNVIGIWCAIPLALVVAGAIPISFAWGNALVYRLVGEEPPPPAGGAARPAPTAGREGGEGRPGPQGRERREGGESQEGRPGREARQDIRLEGLDAAWAKAAGGVPGWRTITTRFSPNPQSPWVFTVDTGYGGQPQKRQTLTIDRAGSAVMKSEGFEQLTLGRRARSWLRFVHTGEFYGLTGQTIAGIVTAGGAVLVYTGLSLALRRFFSWIRRSKNSTRDQREAAA